MFYRFVKVYSVLLFLLVFKDFKAQMLYTYQTNFHTAFGQIINQPNSTNLLITSIKYSISPIVEIKKSQFLKLSNEGNILDSLNFPQNFQPLSKIIYFNNYYYSYGTKIINYNSGNFSHISVVYKIDEYLNIVQHKVIDSVFNDIIFTNQLLIKNNSIYLGNTHSNENKLYLYKLNTNLSKLDSTKMQGSSFLDLINYKSNFLISGAGMAQSSIYGSNQVAEIDTNFNVLSRKNLDSLMYINAQGCTQGISIQNWVASLFQVATNKYIVCGNNKITYGNCFGSNSKNQNVIFLIENNSVIKNISVIGNINYNTSFININISSCKFNNNIYNASVHNYDTQNPTPPIQTTTTQILFSKTDTLGNTIWVKYFGTPNYIYHPGALSPTADSGFVISGWRYNIVNPTVVGAGEGFVMKLNKEGNQVFVGVKENGGFTTNYHKCYPNPNTGNLYFDFPFNEIIEIKIYDAVGKHVKLISNYESNSTIDIAEFTSGVYFYKATSKTKNYSGKFIKE